MSHEPGYDSHRRKCEAHEALGRVERWVLEQQAGLKLQHTPTCEVILASGMVHRAAGPSVKPTLTPSLGDSVELWYNTVPPKVLEQCSPFRGVSENVQQALHLTEVLFSV